MKTLKKIKLNGLNDAELRDREMNALNGGFERVCGCGCHYAGSGGSSIGDNADANYGIGPSGGHSPGACISDDGDSVYRATIVT